MMVGLKRDLRKPGEGLIYPQEVSTTQYRLCSPYKLINLAADIQNCTRAALWSVCRMLRCYWGAHDAGFWGFSEACVHDYYGRRWPDERGLRCYVRIGEANFLYTSVLIPILTTSGAGIYKFIESQKKAAPLSSYAYYEWIHGYWGTEW